MEEKSSVQEPIVKPPSSFSFREGIDLYLTHNGNRICVNISSWSGAERIYLNGELALRGRNLLSKTSKHPFTIADTQYLLVIHINSILKGDISAKLYVNNEVVDRAYISLDEHFQETEVVKHTETADSRADHNKNSEWPAKLASMMGSAPGAIGTIFLIFLILDWLFK
jgi:hypothetical protein